jgi:hypothetical protein
MLVKVVTDEGDMVIETTVVEMETEVDGGSVCFYMSMNGWGCNWDDDGGCLLKKRRYDHEWWNRKSLMAVVV